MGELMANKRAKPSGSKKGKLHKLFFVGPKDNVMIENLADRLIELRFVQEVFLEDHITGYKVMVRFFPENEPKRPETYITTNVSKDFGKVVKG